jgi:hypothetical protein
MKAKKTRLWIIIVTVIAVVIACIVGSLLIEVYYPAQQPSTGGPGSTSTGFNPFNVLSHSCGPNAGLSAEFSNGAGAAITINWIAMTTSSGLSPSTANSSTIGKYLVGSIWAANQTVADGGLFYFNGTTLGTALVPLLCSTLEARYSATIQIGFTEKTSSKSTNFVSEGTIAGTAKSNNAAINSTNTQGSPLSTNNGLAEALVIAAGITMIVILIVLFTRRRKR